jgi:hypothetical protein
MSTDAGVDLEPEMEGLGGSAPGVPTLDALDGGE